MGKRLAVVLAVLGIAAALIVMRRLRTGSPSGPAGGHESVQGSGIDYRLSPLIAAFNAPDGGTPCETAYLAFSAVDEGAKKSGSMHVPWTTFPDKATFTARCEALPPQEQLCAQPRYMAQNHPVCDPIQKDYDKHSPFWN
jgi:hypothetical protein